MGIPKFYRWISERYPCLSQVVKDYQVPEFDNFYLDMNGIIHVCSHPNDDDPTFRISEDKIFTEIFRYIESLFRMIKPRKVLFLAVDGVAPRAKMNQQRGRRFRSAREAQDLVRKALQKGTILPSEPRFDSNCITPGTDFMVRLHEQLKYFVNQKVATDHSWQNVEVVLSGQEVPGEGEHKIMDYIRHQKAQPDYNPNTRHCLYGLDADLIMLGLVSHEPHFCLLREEVRFGKKNQKRHASASTITFHLLHLTILREYIEHEFSSLKTGLQFPYDLESVIDDWVLLCFLVGNDFLPNLPNMHIKQDALPFLYKKYMEVLPTLDGYINEAGNLNMRRFETFLKAVAEFDYDFYSELISDMKWMKAKTLGSNRRANKKKTTAAKAAVPVGGEGGDKQSSPDSEVGEAGRVEGGGEGGESKKEDSKKEESKKEENKEEEESKEVEEEAAKSEERELVGFFSGRDEETSVDDLDEDSEASVKLKRDLGIPSIKTYFEEEDDDRVYSFESDLAEMKSRYYHEKLGFLRIDNSVLAEQAKCYVVGVQWVLSYYYHGVPSWSWFYPYHYAPFVSDVKGFGDLQIEFELCTPFLPFEQLLGVLPPASKSLLPKPFQALMLNDDSPIKEYYPVEFQTDLNGKAQEWEAVVLIPFINEERLLEAMKEKTGSLIEEEVKRNVHGMCQVYRFDSELEASTYPSPWPQAFPDIAHCKVQCSELPAVPYPITRDKLVPGLVPGVKLDIFFPGFPTLKHVAHTAKLEKRGVRVFQAASRDDNMCLTVQPKPDVTKDLYKLATQLVGLQCYVGWPYLVEAKVHAISDGRTKYYADPAHGSKVNILTSVMREKEVAQWTADATQTSRQCAEFRGVDTAPVEVLVYGNVLQGKRYIVDKNARGSLVLHKEWRPLPEPYPYDLTVVDIAVHAPEYKEKSITLEELFKPKDQCFLLANPHYGFQAEVMSVDSDQVRIQIRVKVLSEPDMMAVIGNCDHLSVYYVPSYVAAQQLGLKSLVLSRISGSIQVEKGSRDNPKERERVNVGLSLKFDRRRKELQGYCRKSSDGWAYSPAAIDLLKDFMTQFPAMFRYLQDNPKEDKYYESELFSATEGGETLAQAREWLKQLPTNAMETVDCGGQSLDQPQIAAVEKAVLDMKQQPPKSLKTAKLRVKPSVLFLPSVHQGAIVPDPKAEYYLFDRVINVAANTAVPFGLKGTVIGIQGGGNEVGTHYEILFDEEFLGGLTLRCSPNRAYRLPLSCLINISHGLRLKNPPKQSPSYRHQQQSGQPQGSYSGAVMGSYSQSSRGRDHTPYRHAQQHHPQQSHHHHQHFVSSGHTPGQRYSPGHDERDYPGSRGSDYGRPWGAGGRREREREREGEGRGRGRGRGRARDRDNAMAGRGELEEGGSGRGREREREGEGRGRGRARDRDNVPRIILKKQDTHSRTGASPKTSTAPEFNVTLQGAQSKSPKEASPSPPKRQKKGGRGGEGKVSVREGNDSFSAAISALEKLEISPSEKTLSSPGSGRKERPKSGGRGAKKVDMRELSPSVAAVFDAVGSGQQRQSTSSKTSPPTGASNKPSVTLKAMLKMEEDGELRREGEEGAVDTQVLASMPEAIQKLMQPATNTPRGPLLPRPRYPMQPHSHPPPPPSQFYPGPRPDYASGPPPPIMPFGPPPMDPLSVLQQTCQMTGQPPPKITTRLTKQGYVGTVMLGKNKYNGVPCPSADEAKQSAAAIANTTLPPLPMMMFYPMPYMGPPGPGPGPYGGPPPLPPHVPPYLAPMQPAYHPRGPQPMMHQPIHGSAPPSFVPLQVQRRQTTQRPPHPHSKQDKTFKASSVPSSSRRVSSGSGRAKKASTEYAQEEGSVSITDDEKVQVERAKRNLQAPVSTAAPNEVVEVGNESRDVSDGVEGGVSPSLVGEVEKQRIASLTQTMTVLNLQAPVSTAAPNEVVEVGNELHDVSDGVDGGVPPSLVGEVEKQEESLMKRLKIVEKERVEAEQRIASLTQTMTVLKDTSSEVESPNVTVPLSEAGTTIEGERVEEKTSVVADDAVAQAAIVTVQETSKEDSDDEYQEAVQSSDAGAGGVRMAEVHVVGEILGGESVGEILGGESVMIPPPTAGQSDTNLSVLDTTQTATAASDTGTTPQSNSYPTVADGQPATTDQPLPTPATTSQTVDTTSTSQAEGAASASKPSPLPTSASLPATAVKISRPKRQLAASFTKGTS